MVRSSDRNQDIKEYWKDSVGGDQNLNKIFLKKEKLRNKVNRSNPVENQHLGGKF